MTQEKHCKTTKTLRLELTSNRKNGKRMKKDIETGRSGFFSMKLYSTKINGKRCYLCIYFRTMDGKDQNK